MGGTGPGLRSVFSFLGRFFSKRLQREAPDPGGTDVEVIDEVPLGRGCLEGLEPAPCVRRRALLTDAASEWTLPKEDAQAAKRHTERCSASPVVREMRLKTTTRYRLTPGRMAAAS